ncbi:MAG: hypothetical protein H6738_12840 [Alphaproteobacteria bacterium]|nr:hypothetical protein [Alphaproteobacteria bacterium]MCB9697661.1 hypothetical protein [Alphaproteobacteria bacterium]
MLEDESLIRDALAERLGLQVSSSRLRGEVDGAPVEVAISVTRQVPHHAATLDLSTGQMTPIASPLQFSVAVHLPFRPRLDAGLKVGPAGGFLALQAAGRVGPEQRLAVATPEPERTSALLGPEALAALDAAFVGDPGPTLDDGGIGWTWRGLAPWPTTDVITEVVRNLARVWTQVDTAARTLDPPKAVADAWLVLAGMDLVPGVAIRGCPAGVMGEIRGAGVSVTVAPHHDGRWYVRAGVQLARPIPGNPKVLREDRFGFFDRLGAMVAGRPEIEVGDSAFDKRFAIRSLKPDELKTVLDADVRKAMLALDGLVPVELRATSIDARGPVSGERDLVHVVQATLALARFVADATDV